MGKREIKQFRTALWCNYVFLKLGIVGPECLKASSLRNAIKGIDPAESLVSKIESTLVGREAKHAFRDVFYDSEVNWSRYAQGSSGITGNYLINQLDKVVHGSRDYFKNGPYFLFELLSSENVEVSWEILQRAYISFARSFPEGRYEKSMVKVKEKPVNEFLIDGDFNTSIDVDYISCFFNTGWEKQLSRLSTIFPEVAESVYFSLNEKHNFNIAMLELVQMCFIAKHTTNVTRYSDLGKLLFSDLHCGLAYQLHEFYQVPEHIWFKIDLFRKAACEMRFSPNLIPENIEFVEAALKSHINR
ncbi:TPA: hypothetical protein ACOL2D_002361 [Vibrio parahaemolyticus]